MKWRLAGIALAVTAGLVQSQTARTEFAVASIKPNHTGCCTTYGAGNGGSGGKNVTLKVLIASRSDPNRSWHPGRECRDVVLVRYHALESDWIV